ncbi:hypothetical protein AB0M45_29705 [Nocardia sp. NPDC051787]|uniref:hypothetical protein n=1 Tax=Nocardia sp. NPDC051787 TaxID=3155415 RepID=UPI0034492C2E
MTRRVTVMSPQTRLARARGHRHHRVPAPAPLLEADRARRNYHAQRRRAVPTLTALFLVLFGIPMLVYLWPGLGDVRVWDIPVSWLALWLVPYPTFALLGFWHLRRAEAVESRPDGAARSATVSAFGETEDC